MMSALKIKLCDLNVSDIGSLKSMLHLTKAQHQSEWKIVLSGIADLCIYSFESEKSISAWQKHGESDGMSVLFSTNEDVDVAVDMVLKKPLRTKNFADMLNRASKQIKLNSNIKHTSADEPIPAPPNKITAIAPTTKKQKPSTPKKAVKKPSLMLELTLPEQIEKTAKQLSTPSAITKSLNEFVATHDNDAFIDSVLTNLIPLNRSPLPVKSRQEILEIYREATLPLMHNWESRLKQLAVLSQTKYFRSVHSLALLIDEMAIGYKILLMESPKQELLSSDEPLLTATNRVAEYSCLSMLHSYCFLRTTPPNSMNTLNLLYLYCEKNGALELKISTKNNPLSRSFSLLYNQIILTSIADPFRLTKMEILKLYRLMTKYTTKITITPLTAEQKRVSSSSAAAGHFFIDLTSDNAPLSLEILSAAQRKLPALRVLNTQAALKAIERIFQLAAAAGDNDIYSAEIQLLKKVIPHINTSYEREFERFPFSHDIQANLIQNIVDVHNSLQNSHLSAESKWDIHDRGLGGLMVSTKHSQYHQLDVDDFYGVFGTPDSPLISLVRWLRITDNIVVMGLELYNGTPIAVDYILNQGYEQLPALLLRTSNSDSLIVPKDDLIIAGQTLEITEAKKTYTVKINKLIDSSASSDHFSFSTQQQNIS